jgi:hypothetical protein
MLPNLKGEAGSWQHGQSTALVQGVYLYQGSSSRKGAKEQEKAGQEIKQQPTRKVSSLSCLVHRRFKLTRTGGRIGT